MKKVLAVAGACAVMGLIGCDLNPLSNDDSVSIDLTTFTSIPAGATHDVVATIDGSVSISQNDIDGSVVMLDGSSATGVTVSKSTFTEDKKITIKPTNGDMHMEIEVADDACNGQYVFTLTATAGSVTSIKKDTFTVSGGVNCDEPQGTAVVTKTIAAGSNGNSTLGSSIDLDLGVAYKMSDAASKVAQLDICYSTTGTGVDKIGSPYWAKASEFDYAVNWASPVDTKFYKTTLTKAQFNEITTQEEIPAFVTASATASSYEAAAGDVFIVKTTENAIVLVLVDEKVAGKTGSITIKTAK